jgi:hypothetical protein
MARRDWMRHVAGLAIAVMLTLALLYTSRFWIWTAPWADTGLFGLRILSPHGDVVRALLGDTALAEYDLLVWGGGGVVVLSLLQWLASRMSR